VTRFLLLLLLATAPAFARDPTGQYTNSPFRQWFEQQHNAQGAWCCNNADGHEYDGDYTFNKDGSVTLLLKSGHYQIEAFKVLKGPNPTGHAVWWHLGSLDGSPITYCFSPGPMGEAQWDYKDA
jgi:hypothetical protein